MSAKYLDCMGREIEMGFLVTHPANLDGEGKPRQFKGIAIVVGRHDEEDKVFIRFTGRDMCYPIDPGQLQVITPKRREEIVRHRSGAKLASVA